MNANPSKPAVPGDTRQTVGAETEAAAATDSTGEVRSEPAPIVTRDQEHAWTKPVTEYLSENVAGMLCYLFGWVSGLVFLFIDRRPFVRFHAAQSVAVFATLHILILALSGFLLGTLFPGLGGALLILRHVLELIWLVAAVVLMLKVAGGERFRVKMASPYADRAARGLK